MLVGLVVYATTEYAQTRRLDSITNQFDTRTIVLIPIAIAINIILGQTVAAVLKVPIYLDSIGTILVGVLAGPIAGALTGALANLIWTYVLPAPFHSDYAAPFFIVAVEIGLVAGIFGRLGFFRSRPNTSTQRLADRRRDRRGHRGSDRDLRVPPVLPGRGRHVLRATGRRCPCIRTRCS